MTPKVFLKWYLLCTQYPVHSTQRPVFYLQFVCLLTADGMDDDLVKPVDIADYAVSARISRMNV